MEQFATPILFLIFNRSDTATLVFAEIKKQHPTKLFIASDGPRADRDGEAEQVRQIREFSINNIDWPCEVKTLFRDKNLGCKLAVSLAINWFFSQVEEGIIIEDDCLPHPTFWRFCQELLDKYRSDERIMHIGASNFQAGIKRGNGSYYFSVHNHIWGWASWRRAWKRYDLSLRGFAQDEMYKKIDQVFSRIGERLYWRRIFKDTKAGKIDTWDYSWFFSCLANGGLACTPNVNLVRNIGFGGQSTHTGLAKKEMVIDSQEMRFPLIHPADIVRDITADGCTNTVIYKTSVVRFIMIRFLKKIKLFGLIKRLLIKYESRFA